MIKILDSEAADFSSALRECLASASADTEQVKSVVADIIADVRTRGDKAVLDLTNQLDDSSCLSCPELEVSKDEMQAALSNIDPLVKDALLASIERVRTYHAAQKEAMGGGGQWSFNDSEGNKLGQLVRSMEKVGVYVPGGKASYPSSVIMTVIPAKVAGVDEVILAVPAPKGVLSEVLLAAAHLCGVDRMFKIGGAQAVAAMAFGTETIPKVDKIVGPGNIYVATAKQLVFGQVGIDMIAGPSELVIVADKSADPDWLVMDMFAQAEHDELAQSILISTDSDLLQAVSNKISEHLPQMARKEIIQKSLADRGALILVPSLEHAAGLVNEIAPEHLEVAIDTPAAVVNLIRHAGAIFVGHHSAEVVGDYTAGPSHVLPTGGTARFASPLGVYDFQVRTSLIQCSPRGAVNLSRTAAILAQEEGLEAHAKSAEFRFRG